MSQDGTETDSAALRRIAQENIDLTAERDTLWTSLDISNAERDAALAVISRVEKLAAEWDGHWAERGVPNPYAARIRAALNSEGGET